MRHELEIYNLMIWKKVHKQITANIIAIQTCQKKQEEAAVKYKECRCIDIK